METNHGTDGKREGAWIQPAEAYRATHPRSIPTARSYPRGASGVYVPIALIESGETDVGELERQRQAAARDPERGPGVYIPYHMMRSAAAQEKGAVGLARELRILHTSHERRGFVAAGTAADELKDHNYDGIQEYDNPIPGWWHMIFWGSIVFAICYTLVYQSPLVPTLQQRHAATEARALEVRFAELRGIPMGEAKILQIMGQDAWLEQGRAAFRQQCALCHGQNGEGLVGPNMTDDYYKNTKTLGGVISVIQDGAANGAMPAQRNLMNENEIALVAAYVASLRGQNLESPREAEGEVIPAWPTLDAEGNVVPAGTP